MRYFSLLLALLLALPANAGRSFNGTSDIIIANGMGTALDISSGPMTVSFWVNPITIQSGVDRIMVSHWAGGVGRGTDGAQFEVGFGAYDGSASSNGEFGYAVGCCGAFGPAYGGCTAAASASTWYHVTLFVDTAGTIHGSATAGMIVTSPTGGSGTCSTYTAFTNSREAGVGNFDIGGTSGTAAFNGIVGEVAVWNTLLSVNQMTALQNICPVGSSARRMGFPNPVGYFPLWGAASPEPDLSGNKNNGTVTGTQTANHPPCTQ
jgi:Concanavalin A-like lectin/glucanases superfamily